MYVLEVNEPKQRKPRAKRIATSVTYRIAPTVKDCVTISADKYGRSDNQQAEYLLKLGYMHTIGINISSLSEREILEKFDEITMDNKEND